MDTIIGGSLEESGLKRTRCSSYILSTLCFLLLTTGCVGPISPFGALHSFSFLSKTSTEPISITNESPIQIRFLPKRQILHSKSDLVVEIQDTQDIPSLSNVRVFFNSFDVTSTFMSNIEVKNRVKEKILEIEFKEIRLKLLDENNIRIGYSKNNSLYASQFQAPTCDFFESKPINNIQGFRPPSEYILWLTEIAKAQKFNPNLLTGVVAQESGFNPNAVSWAKAIGLTQITHLAQEQLRVEEKSWPQSREISSLSYMDLKQKISTGELNHQNEWRLDPKTSLQGGAEYIHYLHKYWSLEENQVWLKKLSGEPNVVLSQVILASYNSGPARVKNAIISDNNEWLKKAELKEASKYIRKVFSYCYHFSERSVSDDG